MLPPYAVGSVLRQVCVDSYQNGRQNDTASLDSLQSLYGCSKTSVPDGQDQLRSKTCLAAEAEAVRRAYFALRFGTTAGVSTCLM